MTRMHITGLTQVFDHVNPGLIMLYMLFPFGEYQLITLWLFNIAMGNDPFIDGLAINNGDFPWLC